MFPNKCLSKRVAERRELQAKKRDHLGLLTSDSSVWFSAEKALKISDKCTEIFFPALKFIVVQTFPFEVNWEIRNISNLKMFFRQGWDTLGSAQY